MTEYTYNDVPMADAMSSMRVNLARGIAAAIITGIDELAELGTPLTQLQRIKLTEMAVGSYGDQIVEAEADLKAAAMLAGARGRSS